MRIIQIIAGFAALAAVCWNAPAPAQAPDALTATTIQPFAAFSEFVVMPLPLPFKQAFHDAKGDQAIWESVPAGETVDDWTQMITVTAARNLADRPDMTLPVLAQMLGQGFRAGCRPSFAAYWLSKKTVDGHEGMAVVMSCGLSPPLHGRKSETTLFLIIKGVHDMYTLQWAERAAPSQQPLPLDREKWMGRLETLSSARFCPRPGEETAPAAACIAARP